MSKPGYWERKFIAERDRRYKEVVVEQQKALSIKEGKDAEAMRLAREIQQYKDEKANELREQINSERGLYATKDDLQKVEEKLEALILPLTKSGDRSAGSQLTKAQFAAGLVLVVAVIGVIVAYMNGRV